MVDRRKVFDQTIKNGCSRLKYVLSKEQELDVDLRAVQQINYTGKLCRAENRTIF